MQTPIRALGLVLTLAVGAGCPASPREREGIQAVTTVSPITNIVENIAGELVAVTGIVPEGTNSHTFEPAPADARVLSEADIVFVNGLHLEEPTMDLAAANVANGVPIVTLGERILSPDEYIFDFSFPEEAGDPNPHLWTNPLHALAFAEVVRDELSSLDPEHADDYERNFAEFASRIADLDSALRAATDSVPEENRKLLTYHDSFPYFAREYGWEVVGAVQPSDFSDPAPREVGALIEQIESAGVPAIFGSEEFPSPVLEQIAEASGARYVSALRDDDLPGEPGDPDHSYLGLMVFDYRTIIEALGGDPSPLDEVDTSNLVADPDEASR